METITIGQLVSEMDAQPNGVDHGFVVASRLIVDSIISVTRDAGANFRVCFTPVADGFLVWRMAR